MLNGLKKLYRRIRHTNAARILLPPLSVLLFATYPALYMFTQNAGLLLLKSYVRLLPFYMLLVLVVYGVSLLLNRFRTVRAANAAMAFLLFFNTYGIIYNLLLEQDLVRVEHFILLPLFVFLGLYSAWLVSRIKKDVSYALWRFITLVFVLLTVLSVIRIIPHEVKKAALARTDEQPVSVHIREAQAAYPDIYYLVFDEFPGIRSLREYWKNERVEPFVDFLADRDFFIALESRSSDIWSIHQIATRLNYFDYEYVKGEEETWLYSIANNKAMAYTKSLGYTTVMIEGFSRFFPTMPEIKAEHTYNIDDTRSQLDYVVNDDFTQLVMEATMLQWLTHQPAYLARALEPHRKIISYAIERVPHMQDIASPKFLYLHLTMPHTPYLYDAQGNEQDPALYFDWIAYEDYTEYSMSVIEDMIAGILENADSANPPVIILQSDHGARVKANNKTFRDFPPEFQRDILFAMYLPGYDTSTLPQDLDPINTLPIVFNHYLGAGIPLQGIPLQ